MSLDQILIFAVLAAMMAFFVWNRIRYDLVALLGLTAVMAMGLVPPKSAFLGFSDQVVMLVASALVLSAAVGKSNLLARAIRGLEPHMRTTGRQVMVLTVSVAILSSFMKNIGALAIFMPVAVKVARRANTSVSKLLMPMAFGSLVGGLVTLIGTSPNILVSRVREELTGEPFRMFDFAPVGGAILLASLAFLAMGWRLLPGNRKGQSDAATAFDVAPYLAEAKLPESSRLVGRTVADLEALGDGNVTVTAIIREKHTRYIPAQHWTLFADDILVLQSDPHALQALLTAAPLELAGGASADRNQRDAGQVGVVEAVVTGTSPLVGRSAADLHLRARYRVNLIALSRRGRSIQTQLRKAKILAGDVLVLQGTLEGLPDILKELGCLPLTDRQTGLGQSSRDYLPLLVVGAAIALVATNLVPVTIAFFCAAVLVVLLGILRIDEAYDAIDLPILILLACLIPISDAVSSTGGAALIAGGLAQIARELPATGALSLVLVAAMALTPFLNNAATVLIMAPIAADLAGQLGLRPDAFLMAVAIGAACDFLTPIGHQCNTLVMGPGGYRFGDYWRLGLPLSAIVIAVASALIPLVWPLR